MNIKSNGDITSCSHVLKPVVGNIVRDDFGKIWNSPEIEMNNCFSVECDNCKFVKNCGGGCKGIVFDNNYGKDPLCWG